MKRIQILINESIVVALLWLLFTQCQTPVPSEGPHPSQWQEAASLYFQIYTERDDWERFLSMYDQNMSFEEVILRIKLRGKEEFKAFYNWPDTSFRKHPDYPEALVLEQVLVQDSIAVGRGYFTPFYWKGELKASKHPWGFTIWLYFNKDGKIKKQIDWIEYPPDILKSISESLIKARESS